jgi:hypothetical protein
VGEGEAISTIDMPRSTANWKRVRQRTPFIQEASGPER